MIRCSIVPCLFVFFKFPCSSIWGTLLLELQKIFAGFWKPGCW